MASHASKVQRRAVAQNDLKRLSALIAEHLDIEAPDLVVNNVDPELGQIQQLEVINDLLRAVLDKSGVEVNAEILGSMTKAELMQKAADQGLEVPKSAKKSDIIELLEKAE